MSGWKSWAARTPGVLVCHKLVKNLRHAVDAQLPTRGGMQGADMSVADAETYVRSIFSKVDDFVIRHGGWSGKRVLEVGPGDSLGTGLLCLAAGAASYCAIDRFAVSFEPRLEQSVYRRLFTTMPESAQATCEDVYQSVASGELPASARFRYYNNLAVEAAPAVLGAGRFDFIFSNAVLEHVRDLGRTLEGFQQLLAPGGFMLHDVDLRSHQTHEKHPLHFLEYSPVLWQLMTSHSGEPNRWRLPRYLAKLESLDFVEVQVEITHRFPTELVQQVQQRLAPEFRLLAQEDLEVAVFILTARKEPGARGRGVMGDERDFSSQSAGDDDRVGQDNHDDHDDHEDHDEAVSMPIDGTLDLHMFPPREVKDLVRDYIEECLAQNILDLRIVHGKGTGTLRRMVHSILEAHPAVTWYGHESAAGSWGATVVKLQLPEDRE